MIFGSSEGLSNSAAKLTVCVASADTAVSVRPSSGAFEPLVGEPPRPREAVDVVKDQPDHRRRHERGRQMQPGQGRKLWEKRRDDSVENEHDRQDGASGEQNDFHLGAVASLGRVTRAQCALTASVWRIAARSTFAIASRWPGDSGQPFIDVSVINCATKWHCPFLPSSIRSDRYPGCASAAAHASAQSVSSQSSLPARRIKLETTVQGAASGRWDPLTCERTGA